jgi:hypothetical protein
MSDRRNAWWVVAGLAITVAVVVILAPLASADPDGLERVGEDVGFLDAAQDALYSILPDYTVPGIDDPFATTVVSGLIGVAIVFLVMIGVGRILRRGNT